jgi:hypothetical protein
LKGKLTTVAVTPGTANPGVEVCYTDAYGTGFPIVTADDPTIYESLLLWAAGAVQAV